MHLSILPCVLALPALVSSYGVPLVKRQTDCTQVSVIFNVNVTTAYGESVQVVGSVPEIGNWSVPKAVSLNAAQYTVDSPTWSVSINFPPGTAIEFKFLKWNLDGSLLWEIDPNHRYTVPSTCNLSPILPVSFQYAATSSRLVSTSTISSTTPAVIISTSSSSISTISSSSSNANLATSTLVSPSPTSTISSSATTATSTIPSSSLTTSTILSSTPQSTSVTPTTTSTSSISSTLSAVFTTSTSSSAVSTVSTSSALVSTSTSLPALSTISSSAVSISSSTASTTSALSASSSVSASSTTSTPQTVSASVVAASASPTCQNSPTSRNCWSGGFDINTDFDNHWPNTGRTVSYHFEITNTTLAPDGVSRPMFTINGQYPGPTISANWGDMISVTVVNKLQNNGTSIHFHGIRQWHSNTQDGVPGITECPIAPGASRTYTWQATQYGTSWYHSHFSCQYGDGVVGPIVIQGPATANYDLDLGALPITDWYYSTVSSLSLQTQHRNAAPPTADTALINGTMTSRSGGSYSLTRLTTGKRHRVRLINTSVDNHFMVTLDNHQMQVITADFVPIVPYNTSWLFLGIGQRYDVIITADQAPGNYWFRAEVESACGSNANNFNILAYFSYPGHENETPISTPTPHNQRCTDETQLVPWWNSYIPPQTGYATPDFLNTAINQSTAADGTLTLYWQVNGSALNVHWDKPTLDYVRTNNINYPYGANIISQPLEKTWVYWVVQEVAGSPFTVNVPHPLHLHGHDFFILGTGTSAWDASFAQTLNYNNPPRRDTAMLPEGGWIVLAWQTDNPGAWLFHCHIAWHADEGLGVQFLEAADQIQSVSPVGDDFTNQCNTWRSFYPSQAAYLQHDSGV